MAKRTPIVVGNWKLNKTLKEGLTLVTELKNQLGAVRGVDVGVAPVFTSIHSIAQRLEGTHIQVGAQNTCAEERGAFTGEVSSSLSKDAGASFTLVGHSERRSLFGESDALVAKKTRAALDAGLGAIVCVGESEAERDSNKTTEVVGRQLSAAIDVLGGDDLGTLVIAYEPVWAIGSGRTATPQQAQEVHAFIRSQMKARFGEEGAAVRIQYGGSVKPGNALELLSEEDIDGALVGGASLVADDFVAIVKAASKTAE